MRRPPPTLVAAAGFVVAVGLVPLALDDFQKSQFAYVAVYMVVILYGGSLAFSRLTGLNFFLVLWVTVVLVALYTVKGGLLSVVWADAAQCVMLVGGGVVLFIVALSALPVLWWLIFPAAGLGAAARG